MVILIIFVALSPGQMVILFIFGAQSKQIKNRVAKSDIFYKKIGM